MFSPTLLRPPVVVLDPGHGGRPEPLSSGRGEHWDPFSRRFLNHYRFGCVAYSGGRRWTEHEVMMDLARRVRRWLETASDPVRWGGFVRMARSYGLMPLKGAIPFHVHLSREGCWRDAPYRNLEDVNAPFRIFDSPAVYPWRPGAPMAPGRLSRINALRPSLVVCLHMNGNRNRRLRGMNALFVPSWSFFEQVREYILGKRKLSSVRPRRIIARWSLQGPGRTRVQWMCNDTWTYFTGYGSTRDGRHVDTRKNIGLRMNDLQWRYGWPVARRVASLEGPFEGAFWDRERSRYEALRRSGGPEGYGGDNLYASQELLRFVRHCLWKDYLRMRGEAGGGKENPLADYPAADPVRLSRRAYLGPHMRPSASDWAVPLYVNAVAAYLELGYLTNERDFWLVTKRNEVLARGLALGIYSLYGGMKVVSSAGPGRPRGMPIDWTGYDTEDGSYFDEVVEDGRTD